MEQNNDHMRVMREIQFRTSFKKWESFKDYAGPMTPGVPGAKGCYKDQNVTVLAILERLELKIFSCQPTMVADNTLH